MKLILTLLLLIQVAPVWAQAAGLANISLVAADDGSGKGLSKYAIDLSR